MSEEFAEIIEKCNTGNIKDKMEGIVESISTISNIIVDAMEEFDKRIIILEEKVNSISVQHIEELPEPITERKELSTIPSQVSDKEPENSAVKDIGKPSVRVAIIGELGELFEKRRKKLENKTN